MKSRQMKFLSICIDIGVVLVSALLAQFLITWESIGRFVAPPIFWGWIVFNAALLIIWLNAFGLYSIPLKSISLIDVVQFFLVSVILGCLNVLFIALIGREGGIGYSTALLFTVLVFIGGMVWRFFKRVTVTLNSTYRQDKDNPKKRVMIVGCGEAGIALIKDTLYSEKCNYKPVCAIDDDKFLQGKTIYSVEVVGTTDQIKNWAQKRNVEEIFISMPGVGNKRKSEIIKICQETNLPIKVLPSMYQLANGQVTASKLREVEIEDLLGRDQIKVDLQEVMGYIKEKTVLVTGGGGSIGSELCRQIAMHQPARLIILDIYENNAYEIEQELKQMYPKMDLLVLIASIRDEKKMMDVFEKYRPQIVFNAAAHKHVPLMETSPNEAVKNNVFGTLNVARAADKYEVETFVQISTDKAVNPTNIMGATKRICEMIIQTIGRTSKKTKFVAVRFGNVLGSNGSVIPLFKRQIKEGGPVTVTHKDIIRYFMTIPEAVALVLEAGAYAKDGQIFVLDMGEPVRIYDLAYNLIKLSGLEPNVDIEIKCTGLRPGEKLYEERLMEEEGLQETANGSINIAKPIFIEEDKLWKTLGFLYEAAYSETDKMKEYVQQLVPTYKIEKKENASVSYIKNLQETQELSSEKAKQA